MTKDDSNDCTIGQALTRDQGIRNLAQHITDTRVDAKFSVSDLKKLHHGMKHGTKTSMQQILKCAGVWDPEFEQSIEAII